MDGEQSRAAGSGREWVGSTLGRYRIEAFLAAGGMGEVYRGWDETLAKPVALKVLRRSLAREERWRERFVREARNACRVQHPFVCSMLDVVEDRGDVVLVMEFVDGHTLDEEAPGATDAERGPLGWAIEITEALRAIHETGLVHRDLKPSNVMITHAGHVKVMDFGVARAGGEPDPGGALVSSDSTLTETGRAVGTIAYMSPEQIRGERADARSDLFSLGIVLWQVISGEHPFDRGAPLATASAILNEAPGGGKVPDSITESGPLRDVVMGLLLKDPDDRYASAAELLDDLNAIARGSRVYRRRAAAAVRRRRGVVAAASAVAVAMTAAALIWHERGPKFPPGVTPRPLVAVLPFEVRAGTGDAEMLGQMVSDLVGAAAAGRGTLRRTPPDRMSEMLAGLPASYPRRDALERLRSLATPRWMVAGSVYPAGEGYEASVDVYSERGDAVEAFRVHAASYVAVAEATAVALLDRVAPAGGAGAPSDSYPRSTRSDEAALLLAQARRARRELRLNDALDLTERSLSKDPRYLEAAIERVDLLAASGYGNRSRAAAQELTSLVDSLGLAQNARLRLEADAAAARAAGRSKALYEAQRTLASLNPDDPGLAAALARAALEIGHTDEALDSADHALAMDPKSPALLLLRARVAGALRRFPEARADLERAWGIVDRIDSAPGRAAVVKAQGDLAWKEGRLEDAASLYRRCADAFSALNLEGDASTCRANCAGLEVLAGRLNAARALIVPAISEARSSGALGSAARRLTSFGAALFVGGQLPEAESMLREACGTARQIENDPILLPAQIDLASVIGQMGRFAESRGLADEAIALARTQGNVPAEATAILVTCDGFFADGDSDRARGCYDGVLKMASSLTGHPDIPLWAQLGRSEISEASGDFGDAWVDVRQVLDASPPPPTVQLGYARLREASLLVDFGDLAGSRSALDQAEKVATSAAARIEDLVQRTGNVRALLEMRMGDTAAAATLAAAVADAGRASNATGVTVPALILRAETLLADGRPRDALAAAEEAQDVPGVRYAERVRARVVGARAAAAVGDPSRATELARRALEEAQAGTLRLEIAGAASVLVGLKKSASGAKIDAARSSGRSALDAMLRDCPADRRGSFLNREDIKRMRAALEWSPARLS